MSKRRARSEDDARGLWAKFTGFKRRQLSSGPQIEHWMIGWIVAFAYAGALWALLRL